jgi:predicted acyltransferase (DUF342 family)
MVAILVLALSLVWMLVPLLPALLELRSRGNLKPLEVTDRSAGRISYFARNFKQYLDRVLPQEAGAGDYAARLLDGTEFVRVNRRGDQLAQQQKTEPRLVILDAPQTLPGDQTYLMEVYARGPLTSGPETNYRAVYSDDHLSLGDHNRVFRWAHANGPLTVGAHSVLRGRVSSEDKVVMGRDVVFERAGAPVIASGEVAEPPASTRGELKNWQIPVGAQKVGDHIRIEGDLDIPRETLVSGNLVVTGRLRIGTGALVDGSVKAHQDIELADKARVSGAAVTRSRLAVGEAAWVGGPALAERSVRLGRNAVVGVPSREISVAGVEVELSEGATVYGQISAIRGARTT